ncbi:hypothetical protein Plhal304r1_c017g0060701 [Plasmopara halstedii]
MWLILQHHWSRCGSMGSTGVEFKNFVLFFYEWSRYIEVYQIKFKSEVFVNFKEFKALHGVSYHSRIRCVRTDNLGKFCSNSF